MALFWFGAFNLRSAGCAINDIWDRKIDKQIERTKSRPLAAGNLSLKEAIQFVGVHLTGGLFVLTFLNPPAIFYSLYGFLIGYSYLSSISINLIT